MSGGSGLLGQEILKLDPSIVAPTHGEMNVFVPGMLEKAINQHNPKIFLHLAAKTNPPSHEESPTDGILTNIMGTAAVASVCAQNSVKLVYISTDYVYIGEGPHKEHEFVYAPSNFVRSKLGGEYAVLMLKELGLVIRCSFGPRPFPYEAVYDNQLNSKLYVDEIAPLILQAAQSNLTGILNIGGDPQQLAEYASQSRPAVKLIPTPEWVPKDTSLDLTKWRNYVATK